MKSRIVRFALFLIVMSAGVFAVSFENTTASATELSRRLDYLNAEVIQLSSKLGSGDRDQQGMLERLAHFADERFEILKTLSASDPKAALKRTFSDEALRGIPTGVRDKFERNETIEGELEIIAECDQKVTRTLYFVNTGKEKIRVDFTSMPSGDLITGKQVRVTGMRLNKQIVADQTSIVVESKQSDSSAYTRASTSALPNTTGEQKMLVILVNFQDNQAQPYTVADARDTTFNTISNYYREASYGQTWLTGDVYGWYTIPMNSTNCDTTLIANYSKQAAANAGANLSAYTHYVYAFPQTSACSFSGRGSVGGSPSNMWVNGWYELAIVGHEFGHNLGIYHSRSMDCGDVSMSSSCTYSEYGDTFDLMGGSDSAHFTSYQKERLGWLNAGVSPPLQTITASGTYFIDAYEPGGSNPKGLKVLKSTDQTTGNRTWYYVERRTSFGFDSYLSNYPNMVNGVVVHTGTEANPQDTYLLDMTPLTSSWYDPALVVGQTFTDSGANVTIKTVSADASGAWVEISVGTTPPPSCSHTNPALVMAPGDSNWQTAGGAFTYSAIITNNDASSCGASDFSLSASLPTGWSASVPQTVNIAPGNNSTINLTISSPISAADGQYNVGLQAVNIADQGSSANTTTRFTIVSGLGVVAQSNSFKYIRTQKATITATIAAAGTPVSGATVSFLLTKSNGSTVTQTATTGSNGVATFIYAFKKQTDPVGLYTVGVTSTFNQYTGKGSTSFNVMK